MRFTYTGFSVCGDRLFEHNLPPHCCELEVMPTEEIIKDFISELREAIKWAISKRKEIRKRNDERV